MNLRQIITHASSLAVRVVIALAIFGLLSAQASAGMHGKLCPSEAQISSKAHIDAHLAQSVSSGSEDHTHPAADTTNGKLVDGKFAEVQNPAPYSADPAECCKSFCSSIALLCNESVKDEFYDTEKLNAFEIKQLEAEAAAAIFTPPNA